jgi:hypothetical protein
MNAHALLAHAIYAPQIVTLVLIVLVWSVLVLSLLVLSIAMFVKWKPAAGGLCLWISLWSCFPLRNLAGYDSDMLQDFYLATSVAAASALLFLLIIRIRRKT